MTEPAVLSVPPQAVAETVITTEQCVLGCMILSKVAAEAVMPIVKPDDFTRPMHVELFRTLADMYTRSQPVDIVTLAAVLANTSAPTNSHASYLAWIGGAGYLHTLIATVPSEASASHYAEIVHDAAVRRRLTQAGYRIAQLGSHATDYDPSALVDQARQEIDHVLGDPRSKSVPLKTALAAAISGIGQDKEPGVSTGFRDLDKLIGPLRPGMLVVIAGRPGQGKTILAADIARHVALKLDRTALYATFEMSVDEMALRTLAAEAAVPYERLRDGTLSDIEMAKLEGAARRIEDAPLEIWDAAGAGLMDIRAEGRRHQRTSRPLGLIVVDYLQLMEAHQLVGVNPRNSTRQEQVAALSRGLKLTAKELHAPVIAVAQLNRGPEQRLDKRPQLSDLRESGAVEQDADVVILVHRDDYYDPTKKLGEVDFIVAKDRHGATGKVSAAAQLHLMRFKDFAPDFW